MQPVDVLESRDTRHKGVPEDRSIESFTCERRSASRRRTVRSHRPQAPARRCSVVQREGLGRRPRRGSARWLQDRVVVSRRAPHHVALAPRTSRGECRQSSRPFRRSVQKRGSQSTLRDRFDRPGAPGSSRCLIELLLIDSESSSPRSDCRTARFARRLRVGAGRGSRDARAAGTSTPDVRRFRWSFAARGLALHNATDCSSVVWTLTIIRG
jgi:hypothetical protein